MPATTIELDGRPVGCLDTGDAGDGRAPLLLLHGFTGSKEDFAAVVEPLGRDRRVVAVDLPGHRDTPGTGDPAASGLGALTRWVLEVADALGFADFHLLGHSFGGLLAQRVAAAASQRLCSLVLADSGLGALREDAADRIARVAVAARDEGMAAALAVAQELAGERAVPAPADPQRAAFVEERYLDLDPAAVVGEARALVGAMPLGAFLRGIDVPVLVVHGEDDDAWLPREQALLARTIAGARLEIVSDSAHVPQLENPRDWLEVVSAFLDEADDRCRSLTTGGA